MATPVARRRTAGRSARVLEAAAGGDSSNAGYSYRLPAAECPNVPRRTGDSGARRRFAGKITSLLPARERHVVHASVGGLSDAGASLHWRTGYRGGNPGGQPAAGGNRRPDRVLREYRGDAHRLW